MAVGMMLNFPAYEQGQGSHLLFIKVRLDLNGDISHVLFNH